MEKRKDQKKADQTEERQITTTLHAKQTQRGGDLGLKIKAWDTFLSGKSKENNFREKKTLPVRKYRGQQCNANTTINVKKEKKKKKKKKKNKNPDPHLVS